MEGTLEKVPFKLRLIIPLFPLAKPVIMLKAPVHWCIAHLMVALIDHKLQNNTGPTCKGVCKIKCDFPHETLEFRET